MRSALESASREIRDLPAHRLVAVGWESLDALDVEALARANGVSFVWDSRASGHGEGEIVVGLGEAATASGEGGTRFAEVRDGARSLFESLVRVGAPRPRLFGGAAFENAACPRFSAFGTASFVLPRLTIECASAARRTTLVARAAELADVDALAREIEHAMRPSVTRGDCPPDVRVAVESSDRFEGMVARAVEAIADGALEKVVLSRASEVVSDEGFVWPDVLARLGGQPSTTRFAVARGDKTFLGASPERLVELARGRVRTEALAGSIARFGDDLEEARRLLASDKDRREHDLVVVAIALALEGRVVGLEKPREPSIRSLRHLHHLVTPIEASAKAETHVLDLVEALHPTPAVSGWPVAAAAQALASIERAPRGWYAGPVGWFDERGEGSFVVGLRSALVERHRALVFAGAGIVKGSDPRAEWEETRVKQSSMLRALGAL